MTKLTSVVGPLFLLSCLTDALAASRPKEVSKNTIQEHEDEDPRPRLQNFGMPKISVDAPIGSHDFSHSDPNFHANREVLEFTQLASGSSDSDLGGHDPRDDNPLATVERVLEEGENMISNALHDELGLSVPTKMVAGNRQEQELGLKLIEMATALLKQLISAPRSQSRLPLGIVSSPEDTKQTTSRAASNNSDSGNNGANGGSIDVARAQRSLLELVEQLTKLGLDETIVQDPLFDMLLDRLKMIVSGFRARPTLRT